MTKSDAIRSALRIAGKPLTLEQLQARIERKVKMICGRQKLYTLLSVMQAAGEIVSEGRGNQRTYDLRRQL